MSSLCQAGLLPTSVRGINSLRAFLHGGLYPRRRHQRQLRGATWPSWSSGLHSEAKDTGTASIAVLREAAASNHLLNDPGGGPVWGALPCFFSPHSDLTSKVLLSPFRT